jgi:hypothetical protein
MCTVYIPVSRLKPALMCLSVCCRAVTTPPSARLYPAPALTRLCSRSPEWNSVSSKDRDRLGLITADDGEFW